MEEIKTQNHHIDQLYLLLECRISSDAQKGMAGRHVKLDN
jgi:hypothetical protein